MDSQYLDSLVYKLGKSFKPNCGFNPIAVRMAKTPLGVGHSECSRVKQNKINKMTESD